MKELVYLLACAVNGETPDKERVAALDLERLYKQAKFHTVRAAVCFALERAGIHDKAFEEAKNKAVRKVVYFDIERGKLLAEFERQEIWYMPLKGSVLKSLYPETGMREMADNDILFDGSRQADVVKIMTANGYEAEVVGKSNQDVYKKPPVLNFEMHTGLFGELQDEKIYAYYCEPMRLMQKDDGNNYGYHFSDNDFYVYITAHEYKHFSSGGTGIRSLLDCYVYQKVKGESLDFPYIERQLEALGIADFESKRRELALKVFASGDVSNLNEDERELMEYYLHSGTYGTIENSMKKQIQNQRNTSGKHARSEYIRNRIFPDMKTMSASVHFVKGRKILYPVGVVYRLFRGTFKNNKHIRSELKILKKYDDK